MSMGANEADVYPVEAIDAGASSGVRRSNTTGKSVGSALKKRFGSMRRKKAEA